jgi:hypothetical protein
MRTQRSKFFVEAFPQPRKKHLDEKGKNTPQA